MKVSYKKDSEKNSEDDACVGEVSFDLNSIPTSRALDSFWLFRGTEPIAHVTNNPSHIRELTSGKIKLQSDPKNLFGSKAFYTSRLLYSTEPAVYGEALILYDLDRSKLKAFNWLSSEEHSKLAEKHGLKKSFHPVPAKKAAAFLSKHGYNAILDEGGGTIYNFLEEADACAIIKEPNKLLKPQGAYPLNPDDFKTTSLRTIKWMRGLGVAGTAYSLYHSGQTILESENPTKETLHQGTLLATSIATGAKAATLAMPFCFKVGCISAPVAWITVPTCLTLASVIGSTAGVVGTEYLWNKIPELFAKSSVSIIPQAYGANNNHLLSIDFYKFNSQQMESLFESSNPLETEIKKLFTLDLSMEEFLQAKALLNGQTPLYKATPNAISAAFKILKDYDDASIVGDSTLSEHTTSEVNRELFYESIYNSLFNHPDVDQKESMSELKYLVDSKLIPQEAGIYFFEKSLQNDIKEVTPLLELSGLSWKTEQMYKNTLMITKDVFRGASLIVSIFNMPNESALISGIGSGIIEVGIGIAALNGAAFASSVFCPVCAIGLGALTIANAIFGFNRSGDDEKHKAIMENLQIISKQIQQTYNLMLDSYKDLKQDHVYLFKTLKMLGEAMNASFNLVFKGVDSLKKDMKSIKDGQYRIYENSVRSFLQEINFFRTQYTEDLIKAELFLKNLKSNLSYLDPYNMEELQKHYSNLIFLLEHKASTNAVIGLASGCEEISLVNLKSSPSDNIGLIYCSLKSEYGNNLPKLVNPALFARGISCLTGLFEQTKIPPNGRNIRLLSQKLKAIYQPTNLFLTELSKNIVLFEQIRDNSIKTQKAVRKEFRVVDQEEVNDLERNLNTNYPFSFISVENNDEIGLHYVHSDNCIKAPDWLVGILPPQILVDEKCYYSTKGGNPRCNNNVGLRGSEHRKYVPKFIHVFGNERSDSSIAAGKSQKLSDFISILNSNATALSEQKLSIFYHHTGINMNEECHNPPMFPPIDSQSPIFDSSFVSIKWFLAHLIGLGKLRFNYRFESSNYYETRDHAYGNVKTVERYTTQALDRYVVTFRFREPDDTDILRTTGGYFEDFNIYKFSNKFIYVNKNSLEIERRTKPFSYIDDDPYNFYHSDMDITILTEKAFERKCCHYDIFTEVPRMRDDRHTFTRKELESHKTYKVLKDTYKISEQRENELQLDEMIEAGMGELRIKLANTALNKLREVGSPLYSTIESLTIQNGIFYQMLCLGFPELCGKKSIYKLLDAKHMPLAHIKLKVLLRRYKGQKEFIYQWLDIFEKTNNGLMNNTIAFIEEQKSLTEKSGKQLTFPIDKLFVEFDLAIDDLLSEFDFKLQKVQNALNVDNYDKALDELTHLYASYEDNAEITYLLAITHIGKGNIFTAGRFLMESYQLNPKNPKLTDELFKQAGLEDKPDICKFIECDENGEPVYTSGANSVKAPFSRISKWFYSLISRENLQGNTADNDYKTITLNNCQHTGDEMICVNGSWIIRIISKTIEEPLTCEGDFYQQCIPYQDISICEGEETFAIIMPKPLQKYTVGQEFIIGLGKGHFYTLISHITEGILKKSSKLNKLQNKKTIDTISRFCSSSIIAVIEQPKSITMFFAPIILREAVEWFVPKDYKIKGLIPYGITALFVGIQIGQSISENDGFALADIISGLMKTIGFTISSILTSAAIKIAPKACKYIYGFFYNDAQPNVSAPVVITKDKSKRLMYVQIAE
jgi:hypothetical protein